MGPGNRPLDLEWLEDFLALAETGNFSRAAEARAIAQPAFSRHIRDLEDWVGVDVTLMMTDSRGWELIRVHSSSASHIIMMPRDDLLY